MCISQPGTSTSTVFVFLVALNKERVKFLPKAFVLFQSALISDHSCSLHIHPYLRDSLKQAHIILAFSLGYSDKNQFDNSVTGKTFQPRAWFCF